MTLFESIKTNRPFFCWRQIPEQDASIQHISIDPGANFMAAINNKGNCYVWSLSGSSKLVDGEDGVGPTQLKPRSRLMAHKRYGLKCKFR